MDVKEVMAELRSMIEGARTRPMSSSVVVNRQQALDLISRLEDALPDALARGGASRPTQGAHAGVLEEAEAMLADARTERDRLVSETEVYRVAKVEAEQVRNAAEREAAELRQQADDYVDTRLATFEITLTKTLEAVSRGRARLHGRSLYHDLAETDESGAGGPEPTHEGGVAPAEATGSTGSDQGA